MLQGSLRIITARNAAGDDRDNRRTDSYLEQLTKLFPAEVLPIYATGKALLASNDPGHVFPLLCAAGVLIVRLVGTKPASGGPPQYIAAATSLISFLLWVVISRDWFLPVPEPANAVSIATAASLVWIWAAPQIVTRFE